MALLKQRRRQFQRFVSLLASFFVIAGCTFKGCSSKKDISAEDQLHNYISSAVNVTTAEDKEKLVALTTGELRAAISAASDEAFKKAYIDKKYDFKGFEIVERREIEPGKTVELDFRLNYKSWAVGEEPDLVPFVETLNRAQLVYELGRWVLASVQSLETSFDWEVGLPLDNVDTTGVSPDDEPKKVKSSRESEEQTGSTQAEDTDKVPGSGN